MSRPRIQSIDALRGAIMIIMALDHVRDFFHAAAFGFSPEDLSRTTAAIFFTRWITHFCAPVFMFTAGLGAFLWSQNGRSKGELSRFLWTRGLWMVFLELTVVRFAFYFNFDYSFVIITVLWALGWSMIALAALVYLPPRLLTALSVAMIVLHNLADGVKASTFGPAAWVWNVLHQLGVITLGSHRLLTAYPLIPWIGVMAAGYCLGPVVLLDPARRQRIFIRLGLGLTLGFLVLRGINIYGDPVRWTAQPNALFTVLSFLRCTKYPPSLDFLLMTLGPALIAMGLMDRLRLSARNPLLVFGRVPLFYFVAHLYLIHLLSILFAYVQYGRASFLWGPPLTMGGPRQAYPADYGFHLGAVYVIWIGLVVLLYPMCRWFGTRKQQGGGWWSSYL